MTNYTEYTCKPIDAAYINSLVNLVNACRIQDVKINTVEHFQNGWRVTFEGYEGDAICHDGSYGSPCYMAGYFGEGHNNDWSREGKWETIGFPWDYDDVSVHTAEELAFFLHCLNANITPWENEDY